MPYYWQITDKSTGEILEKQTPFPTPDDAEQAAIGYQIRERPYARDNEITIRVFDRIHEIGETIEPVITPITMRHNLIISPYELGEKESYPEDGQGIYTKFAIESQPSGGAVVNWETNDNNDDGIPDGEVTTATWHYPSVEAALSFTGKSRTGLYGQPVDVYLDGEKV